jgi:hypothetical protein
MRDIIAPMNYRRGFQRLYLFFSVLWIAAVLALSIRDRPRAIDYDALAKSHGAIEVDPSDVKPLPPPPSGYTLVPSPKIPFVPPPARIG